MSIVTTDRLLDNFGEKNSLAASDALRDAYSEFNAIAVSLQDTDCSTIAVPFANNDLAGAAAAADALFGDKFKGDKYYDLQPFTSEFYVYIMYKENELYFAVDYPLLDDSGEQFAFVSVETKYDPNSVFGNEISKDNEWTYIMWACIVVGCIALLFPIIHTQISKLIKPIRLISAAAQTLATGDVDVRIIRDRHDEIGQLQESMNALSDMMRNQALAIESLADGDLTSEYTPRGENDIVGNSIAKMLYMNHQALRGIAESTAQVKLSSAQLAEGSDNLARGATDQSAAIQDLAGTITEISEAVEKNSDNALNA
ncbi:MAG: HAMP domain-containing protein, partial [Oscillospiraceae bacterium]|nr:HAMP domain-containing protein [Oscillospiraceae bacterium]